LGVVGSGDTASAGVPLADSPRDRPAERRYWILTHPEQGVRDPGTRRGHGRRRNPGDESVDPNFSRSSGRTPS